MPSSKKPKSQKQAQHPLVDASHTPDNHGTARAEQALRLRVLGYTYAEIAARCGYRDHTGAMKAIKKLQSRYVREETRTLVDRQHERIEIAINAVMVAIVDWPPQKKLWAVDRLTPLLKREAELMGMDAPKPDASQGAQMLVIPIAADVLEAV